jgi:tRNA threonylcarbamoyl adenosine modification protein YeaZ
MKILALETTGNQLGVCLWEDFRVRALKLSNGEQSQSSRLMPALDELFKKVGWNLQELDALAVDVGPGRFTGIRLGVSAARTLSQTLQKPVVEISSLEALAAQGSGWQTGKSFVWKFPHDLLCVLMDALRDDVYMAVWRFHKLTERSRRGLPSGRSFHTFGHHFKLVHAPTLFPFDRFLSFFQSCFQAQTLLFVGSAAQRYRKELNKAFGTKARFLPQVSQVDPRWVAALGSEKFFRRETKSYNQVKPLYLRPSYVEEAVAKNGN